MNEVVSALYSDWISTGPRVKRFENDFASFIGAPAALAVNSGTSALHVGLAALGIQEGDEVLTTPMSFCSSAHVIEHVGAKPVLVDVESDTLNIDPDLMEAAIVAASKRAGGRRIKAILPVHLYGHPCELHWLRRVAVHYGLSILEDAAHALPAEYCGVNIGATDARDHARLVAFSFYATKNLTTAEGGMLVGSTPLLDDARLWSLHGMSRDAYKRYSSGGSWHYDVVVPGFKYNMTDIQAAIGLHQLKKLPEFHLRRDQIARRYNRAFKSLEQLDLPAERPNVRHAWHLYVVRLNLEMLTIDRAAFIRELGSLNIGTSVHFIPIHLHTYYQQKYGFNPTDFPIAFEQYQRLVSLPLNPRMTDADVEDVIEAVTAVVDRHRR